MRHWYMQLDGRKSTCQGGIGIAVNQHCVRLLFQQNTFDFTEHAACHGPVRTTMNIQVVSRPGHAQFSKENIRHVGIEMLARMNDHLIEGVCFCDSSGHGTGLDELRACAEHCNYFLHILDCSGRKQFSV
eukprot:Amastigsp_a512291_7.p2 type:complete len:130 gc:universal Amastigsp_a512291_7:429-40(-)